MRKTKSIFNSIFKTAANSGRRVHLFGNKFIREFREFAMRGNVIDLAVGIIIGGGFSKIVSSLVNDLITPLLSVFTSATQFSDLKLIIRNKIDASEIDGIKGRAEVAILYGSFLQTVLDFMIVAFCVFLLVKAINTFRRALDIKMYRQKPNRSEAALEEIRDMLKSYIPKQNQSDDTSLDMKNKD